MNETQKYFIHLLSSHLNNSPPLPNESADWMGVFKLGELHNVTAMLTLSIKKLPENQRPEKKIMSYFNQALGMTLQRYNSKCAAIDKFDEVLNKSHISHLYLKGASIRDYYPVPDVRTSGDIDVVVDENRLKEISDLLLENDFSLEQHSDSQHVMCYGNEEFEIKNYIECLNKSIEDYFKPNFDEKKCELKSDNIYYLKPTYHLIFVISHMLSHLAFGGVGIRQLMDIDVLLRSGEIDFNELFSVIKELNIEKSSLVLMALSKEYFNTPVDIDFTIDKELKEMLEKVMLEGGVFGFAISDAGTVRLVKSMSTHRNKKHSSLKAFFMLLFPAKQYFYNSFPYCNKHHFLLPIAYFHRLFTAIFKRRKQNLQSVKTIFSDKDTALMISDILNELEIEKDF